MRHFMSYGPVDARKHFCAPRSALVRHCVDNLIGEEEDEGHYFTIYAPRQAGKTWLMRQAVNEIRLKFGDRFLVGTMSMQGVRIRDGESEEGFLSRIPRLFALTFGLEVQAPESYEDFLDLFRRDLDHFDRPVILLIDEFDKLPRNTLDALVSAFRDLYLDRGNYWLHGLALVGVRAVLGVDSPRGSPFNVQRTLHVPNFSREEVEDLFGQYQAESGQTVLPEVVEQIYDAVRGQPGLTSWFGELLTEKHNLDPSQPIGLAQWQEVYARALYIERNNNVLNLVAKAKAPYARELHELFVSPDVPFTVEEPWCDYLELQGIIAARPVTDAAGQKSFVCRFASPFVQRRLYNAFSFQLRKMLAGVPVLDGMDTLEDVFTSDDPLGAEACAERIDAVALLGRYKIHLEDLRELGRDPFRDQPMRADFQLPEAVGHFHLYAWLLQALGRLCTITPEFPTGNGKVDLLLRRNGCMTLVEVKSLGAAWELPRARAQAARYAKQQGLSEATLALFVPTKRPEVVGKLEETTETEGVKVHVVAVSWRP